MIKNQSIIADARVLSPEHSPREFVHRDGAIDELASALEFVTDGGPTETVCVFGPSGTGKTTLARYVAEQVASHNGIRWGYVDAAQWSGQAAILHELLRDAGAGNHLPRDGISTDRLVNELRDLDGHLLAVVDEVGMIPDDRTLLTLQKLPNVSLITCTIDENDFFASVDDRVRSRFRSSSVVTLDKYSHAQLVDILTQRARVGLVDGVLADGVLDRIADLTAGDARWAIATLYQAAKQARNDGVDQITTGDLREHSRAAQASMFEDLRGNLGTHKRLLLDIVQEEGEIGCSSLRVEYERRIGSPKSGSTRRRMLESLEGYGAIEGVGNGPARRYFAVSPKEWKSG